MKLKILLMAICIAIPVIALPQSKKTRQAPAEKNTKTEQPVAVQTKQMPPIIDIHVHAIKVGDSDWGDLCPWFLKSMPGTDPKTGMTFSFGGDCVEPLKAAKSTEELTTSFIETINRLNITAVVFSDDELLRQWKTLAPDRIIPGIGVSSPNDISVADMEKALSSGYYKVMSECAPQYQGLSPSDMSLDAYFALAEKMDIPVGIHMGTGGNGMTNITGSKYRAAMGNPFELEDLLHRHPNLRVWVQHAAYPMIDELIAVLGYNAYVFVDLSGFIWSYPQEEIHMVIKRLIQAGFGKRLMYGTDFIVWPKMIEASIGLIQNSSYLTEEQKRDILYNNAARFLRIKEIDMK
jgi:predicted TIM-barrel fold metal-dependent hydrolase